VDKKLTGGIQGFQAGLAFSWTEGKQDAVGGRVPLASVDPWKIVGYLGYVDPADTWGVRLSATYVAKKSAKDIGPETTGTLVDPVDSYFLLDVTAFYRFDEHWSVNVGVNNLTDKEYVIWSSARASSGGMGSGRYSEPGVNGFVSVTAKF
jgi:outer membrane receptor protein involved in Fe transport